MIRRGALTLIRKELAAYFNSPIAYIFLFVFVALLGFLYTSQFFLVARADLRVLFNFLPVILCAFLPAVAMRLWAEEKAAGTYELLLTLPLRPRELVLGKFVASFLFYLTALAATATIPVMLAAIGRPDPGPIVGGYLGTACLGALFLAIGLFISGLCHDQIVAFIVGMLSCFALLLIGTEFIASTIDGWLPGLGGLLMTGVGVPRHFASFQKGVVDVRDTLYFLLGTGLVLTLNGFWIEGRMRPGQRRTFAIAAALAGAIFVVGNWIVSDLALGRFDLTAGKLYTMSPSSKRILDGLKAPVTVKYYVSPEDKMPTGLKTLERDVLDKLDEFRLASSGKLQYKVFRMEAANVTQPSGTGPEESLEASARRKGIQPFQVQSIEADELGLRLVYSAMAIAYKEKPEEILPRVISDNLNELEYLVLSRIYRMTLPQTPTVALVAPFEETPLDPNLHALLSQLGQSAPEKQVKDAYRMVLLLLESEGYTTKRIEVTGDTAIPADAKTLLLLEPGSMTDVQQRAISRFLVEGGSLLVAEQAHQYDYATSGTGEITVIPRSQPLGVNALLRSWGLSIDERVLLDASQEAVTVGGGMRLGPFAFNLPLKLPVHIRVNPEGMSQEMSITSRLSPILYLWGSALSLDQGTLESRRLKARVLLRSSGGSWLIPAERIQTMSPALRPQAGDAIGPFPLAVLIEGEFPDPMEGSRGATLTPKPGKLLAVGAVTPFQEQLISQGGHARLLLNAVDALTLGEELIEIRAKQPVDRSIGPVSSGVKAWWRFFSSLLVPLCIAGLGWMRMAWRRRAQQQYVQVVEAAA
jgi:ABC-type uncharacterized transport system involved in gliding motility auxiliary subunit/ABC-type transport system involved in multi-copper enzyme maturation permease subunit